MCAKMIRFEVLVLVVLVINYAVSQMQSPCPRLFKYEPPNPNQPDRIYGVITLNSDADLNGIWLRVIFDKPSLGLGNWFGMVKTEDNTLYKIQARNKKLIANVPQQVRFYVTYDPSHPPPKLVEIRLNAKTVCPESGEVTEAPVSTEEYYTSPPLAKLQTKQPLVNSAPVVTDRPYSRPVETYPTVDNSPIDNSFERPNSYTGNTEDEVYMGDFALLGKPRPPVFEEQCGTVIKSPQPLITHGQPSSEGEFPWHAALYHTRTKDLAYICGASLISRYHLLTVAHCVTSVKTQNVLSPKSLMVYLGKYYLKAWSNPGIQEKQIEKIFVHPKYHASNYTNDIAVIKLNEPASITNYVRPVCLWQENTNLESVIGKQGTVVGWGFDHTGQLTEQLTKAHMPVVSKDICIYSYPDFYAKFTSTHTYCAGFKNGTSVCNGDSGGGMVFPKAGSDPNNPIWEIRGMVSISVALQNQVICDTKNYVVFTDIAKYLDWIKYALSM